MTTSNLNTTILALQEAYTFNYVKRHDAAECHDTVMLARCKQNMASISNALDELVGPQCSLDMMECAIIDAEEWYSAEEHIENQLLADFFDELIDAYENITCYKQCRRTATSNAELKRLVEHVHRIMDGMTQLVRDKDTAYEYARDAYKAVISK